MKVRILTLVVGIPLNVLFAWRLWDANGADTPANWFNLYACIASQALWLHAIMPPWCTANGRIEITPLQMVTDSERNQIVDEVFGPHVPPNEEPSASGEPPRAGRVAPLRSCTDH